jgi:hypothetical protein
MAKKAKASPERETIRLPVGGIVVTLVKPDESIAGAWDYQSCSIKSGLLDPADVGDDDSREYWGAMHAIESLVLAHAAAGVDIQSPDYIEGLETALDACANEL